MATTGPASCTARSSRPSRGGKLRGKVEAQQYLSVEGNNLIMPSVGVDANGNGYLAFTLVGPITSRVRPAKISLDRSASKVRIVEAGLGPQDGFQRVLDRRLETEVGLLLLRRS